MGTIQRGNQAEAHVLASLVARDMLVLIPFGEGHPYDLVLDLNRHFIRIQCKCAHLYKGCVTFKSCSTDHGTGPRDYHGRADVFGVHFPPTGDVYFVPVAEAATRATALRLGPARNNQRLRVRMAADYAVERWTPARFAALAGRV